MDDGFKWVPPALAPSVPEATGILASAEALARTARRRREEAPALLDNVKQFRFYSAWRACVERRRR